MYKNSIFSKLLKEPLLHFLLIGVGLFYLSSQLNKEKDENTMQQIIINTSKLDRISRAFIEENGRKGTDIELQERVKRDIKEEILYHEALALGLDKDNIVIRHHLAQKMQYLFEDISIIDEPEDEVLKKYLQENPKKFNKPFDEIKYQLKNEWISKELKKENEIFYENLKSHYKIMIDNDVRKSLNMRVL